MEKYQKWAYIGFLVLLGGVFSFLFFKYALAILFPFALALLIVSLARPLINRICKNKKIPKPIVSVIVIALILFFSIYISSLVLIVVVRQLGEVVDIIVENLSKDDNYISKFLDFISLIETKLPFLKQNILEDKTVYSLIISMLKSSLGKISTSIAGYVTSFVTHLPELIITLIVIVLSLFYFSKDYDKIGDFVMKNLPQKISSKIPIIKKDIILAVGKYIKSYLILMLITFIELFCGFLILGIKNAFVLSLVISFVDILPVLGVGSVLVPWSIILFVGGNNRLAIGLLVLYVIVYVLRQFEEPRIVSSQMNVHPLIMLLCMFASLKIFGFGGMLIAPLIAFIVKAVYESIKKQKNIEKTKKV